MEKLWPFVMVNRFISRVAKTTCRKNVTGQVIADVPVVYAVFDIAFINQEQNHFEST